MKNYYFLLIASLIFLINACNQNRPTIHLQSKKPTVAPIVKTDLEGKKLLYDFNTSYFEISIKNDSMLNWRCVAGELKGQTEDVRYYRHNVSKGIVMLSWTDKDKRSVSQVINFNTDSVNTFVQDKKRVISVGGSVQLVETPTPAPAISQITKN